MLPASKYGILTGANEELIILFSTYAPLYYNFHRLKWKKSNGGEWVGSRIRCCGYRHLRSVFCRGGWLWCHNRCEIRGAPLGIKTETFAFWPYLHVQLTMPRATYLFMPNITANLGRLLRDSYLCSVISYSVGGAMWLFLDVWRGVSRTWKDPPVTGNALAPV